MLLNRERLSTLRDEIGAEGFEDVVAMYLKECDEVVARITAPGTGIVTAADLHFLKGNALMLGFEDLADLCRIGETERSADPARLTALYLQSRAALEGDQIRNSDSTSSFVMSR